MHTHTSLLHLYFCYCVNFIDKVVTLRGRSIYKTYVVTVHVTFVYETTDYCTKPKILKIFMSCITKIIIL